MTGGDGRKRTGWRDYFTKPLIVILLMGFASGLPLALSGATLTYWLAEAKVSRASIGLFAAVAAPYTLKFLWSPVMDTGRVPGLTGWLGRRRGWIVLTQLLLAASCFALALTRPELRAMETAYAAFFLAFASASQDIVIDAYRVEILPPDAQGQGAAMAQLGYRLGMLVTGAGALALADHWRWPEVYTLAGALFLGLTLVTFWADEPHAPPAAPRRAWGAWLREAVAAPLAEFTRRPLWLAILLFVLVYRLADAFIGPMTGPFFLDLGFPKTAIAEIVKFYGTIATLLGSFWGAALVARYGTTRILFLAGVLHALTNLCYCLQAETGVYVHLLTVSIFVENVTGGIAAASFVAFASNLCNRHYTATQYALLSSLSAFGRTWLATPSGMVATALGWPGFFALSAALALPGLGLLLYLQRRLPTAAGVYGHVTSGGIDMRIASTLPPVIRPKRVPRS